MQPNFKAIRSCPLTVIAEAINFTASLFSVLFSLDAYWLAAEVVLRTSLLLFSASEARGLCYAVRSNPANNTDKLNY